MRLLFVTQVVDRNDGVLGAYHEWIARLAERIERIEVICLFEGEHDLPHNVTIHSLGKERGKASRYQYAFRFLRKAWDLRDQYDTVFVHMNQEYLLLMGLPWKLLGRKMYLWRNHYAGSLLTDIAASFCTHIFCTSRYSYTAKFRKTVLMPVGVDTDRFSPGTEERRRPGSILFLSRMAPSKNPMLFIEALALLKGKNVPFTATVVGSPIPEYEEYYRSVMQKAEDHGLTERVIFKAGVPNREAVREYRAHELFVNCSPSGMYDKTLFEAAASGCIVLAKSGDFAELAGGDNHFDTPEGLAAALARILNLSGNEKSDASKRMQAIAESQSLEKLMDRLCAVTAGENGASV